MILILGGTAEGRELASALDGRGVVHSLAGRTARPRAEGTVRSGGFGGAAGLAEYLRDNAVRVVVDATHPFAGRMTQNAAVACAEVGVRLVRLSRPGWASHPDAHRWHWVDGHDDASATAARLGGPILLTVGRQHTPAYSGELAGHRVVARVAEEPDVPLPDPWTVLRTLGPFTVDGERALFDEHGIRTLVSKDSGGEHTVAKVDVAAERGCSVVMIRRPAPEPGVPEVASVEACLAWLS